MPTCPNGHQSAADDWCEVCGHRMAAPSGPPNAPSGGAVPAPPPPGQSGGYGFPGPPGPAAAPGPPGQQGYGYPPPAGAPPQAEPERCPQCGAQREAQAPFCEGCRYNFLTNTPTTYAPPPQQPQQPPPPQQQYTGGFPPPGPPQPPPPGFPGQPAPGQDQGFGYDDGSRPSQVNRPAEPLSPGPPAPAQAGPGPQAPPYGGDQYQQHQQYQQYQQQPPPPQAPQAPHAPQAAQPSGDWVLPPPGGAPPQQDPQHPQGMQQGQGMQPGVPHQQQPEAWMAVIAPDREYFTAMMHRSGPEASALNLPAYSPEVQLPLTGHQITIGRRRQSTGESPDIDLGRPPEDPGVSHQHAVLVQQPDGSWSVVDQDSTNGTTVNGGEDPIQPFIPVPLREGDRVHVGAWTTITLRRGHGQAL